MEKINDGIIRLSPNRWQEFREIRTLASYDDTFEEPSHDALEKDARVSVTPGWWRQTLEDSQSGDWLRWVFFERQGRLVAHGMIRREQNPRLAHNASVGQLYVDTEWRGEGIGTLVLKELVRIAISEWGIKNVVSEVTSIDIGLMVLYERCGFVHSGTFLGKVMSEKRGMKEALDVHYYVLNARDS